MHTHTHTHAETHTKTRAGPHTYVEAGEFFSVLAFSVNDIPVYRKDISVSLFLR